MTARCIPSPRQICTWAHYGPDSDREAEKHTRETQHGTVTSEPYSGCPGVWLRGVAGGVRRDQPALLRFAGLRRGGAVRALGLMDDGWTLRNDVIWAKPNGMPESVDDRLRSAHEHVFLMAKSRFYWFDLSPIREPHAEASVRRAAPHRTAPGRSSREGLTHAGIGRKYVGIDLSSEYLDLSLRTRFAQPGLDLGGETA